VIESIIKQCHIKPELFPKEFTEYFMLAAKEGNKNIIDFFISLKVLRIIKLNGLVRGLNSALEQGHEEIVDAVIEDTRLDESFISSDRLYKVFRAALANNHTKVAENITKFIEPRLLYQALESALRHSCMESEDYHTYRDYKDIVEATIHSLTEEFSWEIFKIALTRKNKDLVMMILEHTPLEKLHRAFM
jgi:hypothetical protein